MTMVSWKVLVPAALVAFLSFLAANILQTTRPFKETLPTNDNAKCTLLEEAPWGAEDMVMTPHDGWAICGSLDGGHLFESGVDACDREDTGGLWAFHPIDKKVVSLRLTGLPLQDTPCFHTHGLYLSNTSNRLYAVTHHGTHSSVEVFQVQYPEHKPPSVTWIRSVTSPDFPNMGLNDVVEGANAGELYVTQWLPSFAGMPVTGRKHPSNWKETLGQALLVPAFLMGLKLTKVHHCTFTDDNSVMATCRDASPQRFQVANGITISDDRTTVFVNDATGYTITVLERQHSSGLLERKGGIKLEHASDNIEYKDGKLWTATIPEMSTIFQNEQLPFEERHVVPGGLAVVEQDEDGNWGRQRVTYNHDGSMLSQISSGMAVDGKIILGSAYAKGILVCDES